MGKKKNTKKDNFLKEYLKIISSDEYQNIDKLIKEE